MGTVAVRLVHQSFRDNRVHAGDVLAPLRVARLCYATAVTAAVTVSVFLAAGKQMYESDAIITYLFNEYGDGQVPLALRLGYFTTLTAGLALAPR